MTTNDNLHWQGAIDSLLTRHRSNGPLPFEKRQVFAASLMVMEQPAATYWPRLRAAVLSSVCECEELELGETPSIRDWSSLSEEDIFCLSRIAGLSQPHIPPFDLQEIEDEMIYSLATADLLRAARLSVILSSSCANSTVCDQAKAYLRALSRIAPFEALSAELGNAAQ